MPIDETAERLLDAEPLAGYLATSAEDRPHVAPVWYRYEDGVVEVVTTGRKLENLRANPRAALSVQKADAGVPEWTVTVFGTAAVVDDEAETEAARRRINRRYGVDEDAWTENTLVRIDLGSASWRVYDSEDGEASSEPED
jgi:nitroimidazol reductase NimA-like FMN-containing flavoprotein (pyridoxamine 5'-phosphate oxidase superfamily)